MRPRRAGGQVLLFHSRGRDAPGNNYYYFTVAAATRRGIGIIISQSRPRRAGTRTVYAYTYTVRIRVQCTTTCTECVLYYFIYKYKSSSSYFISSGVDVMRCNVMWFSQSHHAHSAHRKIWVTLPQKKTGEAMALIHSRESRESQSRTVRIALHRMRILFN